MNEPTFSVITPTYNRAVFIKRTIESVLAQTFSDFEIIVVDDGSTDNTGEIVRSIVDDRLTYHFKTNEERAVARNTGVAMARGKYVTFLDSDDLLYEDHLQAAADVISRHGDPEFFHLGYEFRDVTNGKTVKVPDLPAIANDRVILGNCLSCNGVFL